MIPIVDFPSGLRIGLLGGSFNPAHEGHLAISLAALKTLRLDRVVWLVSPHNPLKAAADLADYESRLAQARTVALDPRIIVSDFEARAELSYTIDTVKAFKRLSRGTRFVLLIGADNLAQLARWRNWTGLFASVPIAVFARPGWERPALSSKSAERYRRARLPIHRAGHLAGAEPPAWVFVWTTHREESATAIRARGEWPGPSLAQDP